MQSEAYAGAPAGALAIPLKARGGGVRAWAIVDEQDYEWATQFNWHLREGYARRNVSPRESGLDRWYLTTMHRELVGLEPGDKREVDHINRDRLDNRRSNLRVVTKKQNAHNQGVNVRQNRSSQYRGVSWHKATQKWWAYARINGVLKSAGYYRDEDEAGRAAAEFRRLHMTHAVEEDAA